MEEMNCYVVTDPQTGRWHTADAPMKDLWAFQRFYWRWCQKTFPGQDEQGLINHLKDEVNRELTVGCDPSELADVGLLLCNLASRRGIDLGDQMRLKSEINFRRKFATTPNADGFFPHTEEAADVEVDQASDGAGGYGAVAQGNGQGDPSDRQP